jgi:CobQ-like glutamine amidotransferase family enzyme
MKARGIKSQCFSRSIGEEIDQDFDIVFMGGGQDKGQASIAQDLQLKSRALHEHHMRNVPILTICGAYQLFGKYFITAEGEELPGIGIFNAVTKATDFRMIGNIVIKSDVFGELVGFENHSGVTELLEGSNPLGSVIKGFGNSKDSKTEGILQGSAIGTYLHGSFLPKNPTVADFIIEQAVRLSQPEYSIGELDDWLEYEASKIAKNRS